MHVKTLVAGVAGLLTAGLAIVPLTSTAEAAPTSATRTAAAAVAVPTPPPLVWGRCSDKNLRAAKAECAMLTVPLDYTNPAAGTIQLAVSRVLHTKSLKGAVFTNPGGPGGSGLGLSTLGQYVPKKAGLNYDWYGVDPRGVGDSVPALSCDPSYNGYGRKAYVPKTADIQNYWVTRAQNYATACGNSAAKALLPFLRTEDNAMDFESLRLAIGQAQITWYGFSYGTSIGQVYASLYPTSIKAMILDGVVDPTRPNYQSSNYDQDYAFEKTFDAFFKWVAKYHRVFDLGASKQRVRKLYFKTEKALDKKPALGGKLTSSVFDDAMLGAGYYNLTWLDAAGAWSALVNDGNAKPMKQLFGYDKSDPQADNGYAIYAATECTDSPWPTDLNTYLSDSNTVYAQAPILTWANTWFNLPCRTWPVPSSPQTVVNGSFTGPVLLTAETYDAATPFSGALAARAIFPNSALVEGKKGTSHAVSLYGVKCVDDSIANLLKKGTLPTRKPGNVSDKSCRGLKPPVPTVEGDAPGSGRLAAWLRMPVPFR